MISPTRILSTSNYCFLHAQLLIAPLQYHEKMHAFSPQHPCHSLLPPYCYCREREENVAEEEERKCAKTLTHPGKHFMCFENKFHVGFSESLYWDFILKSLFQNTFYIFHIGMGTGRGGNGFCYPIHISVKKSIPIPISKFNSIKLLSHSHPHRIAGIISYTYPYSFSYYSNINFN